MENFGRTLVVVGLGTALIGGALWGISALFPHFRPGRLPGDIVIESPETKVYVPITTMILLSLAATLVLWLIGTLKR
ncbi:MAG: DUF2905 domain-containing protein [Fimbriimonadaceae bacterium]|nr:DUF2905 domain-containing protein [Fimbriimonadaceae bacterium]QYK57595.1 MAG: DUF2905 domain-containing protein [Fimbriimonadaceae bacterium]